MESHVVFERFDLLAGEHCVEGLEKLRLCYDHAVHMLDTDGGHDTYPIRTGVVLFEIRDGHLVIVGIGVAEVFEFAGGFGELGLECDDVLSFVCCLCAVDTREGEHTRDKCRVGISDLDRDRVGIKIIIAIRQAETTLPHIVSHHVALLGVLARAFIVEYIGTIGMHACGLCHNICGCLHTAYCGQLVAQRLDTLGLDGSGVHTAEPEVCYLLIDACLGGFFDSELVDVFQPAV